VLLLHGWPQHWYEWRHLMPALAGDHRVLALDLRGFGWSEATPEPAGYRKEELASDVLAVLDELGLERVKLVGHDWGGWIGFLLCLRAPERFSRYLALNILHPWVSQRAMLPHLWRFAYQWIVAAPGLGYALHRSGRITRTVLGMGVSDRSAWDDDARESFVTNLAEPARARAAVQLYRQFTLHEVPQTLRGRYARARLTVPTLLLFGAEDAALRPELLAGYEQHADDMRVELVPGCGHFIADERPDIVAERARAFLGATDRVAARHE
jgi:pimeloyl-ACP methyl ester carboxylesterase